MPKMWLTPERVFRIGEWLGPSLPSQAAQPSLKTAASPSQISVYSSLWGASSSAWEGLDLLLDSLSSLVVWNWVEPDCRLWCEAILQKQLCNQAQESHDMLNPADPSEMVGDGAWSAPSLSLRCTLPNTLVRVRNALTSLRKGDTLPCLGCLLL